jgi:all-trans-retinol 13,14-reductase
MAPKIDTSKLPFKVRIFTPKNTPLWTSEKKNIVVIGSGIGGMASAALFAHKGHKVTVLEMNKKHIGGHGRWLSYHGLKFSMGPQYVWEFNEGELGDRFMQYLGIKKKNPFLLMEEKGFEKIIVGNRDFDTNNFFCNFKVPLGLENFRDDLCTLFPDEVDEITLLFNDMIEIYNNFKTYFSDSITNEGRIFLAARFILRGEASFNIKMKMGKVLFQTLLDWFDSYGISSMVRRILYGHGGIFAESESDMSAIAYIIATGNYHKGARYPKKGFHHFFGTMGSVVTKNGGSIERGKKAVKLETDNDHVTAVVCEDGSRYACDFVFSDISPRLTDAMINKKAEKFDYTPSHCIPTICIGFKKGLAAVKEMKGRNYWWQDGNEIEYHKPDVTASPKMLFINSPTANKLTESTDKDLDGLVLFCPGNYDQEKAIYEKGAVEVKRFKKKLAQDIVDILDRNILPGIKEKLVFAEVISSIDIENDIGVERGSAYGRRMSVREVLKGSIEEMEKPHNLYNVSSTKNFPGIAEGISTASLLLEELTGEKI